MKKLLMIIAACVLSANLFAQNKVYCEIVESNVWASKSIKVLIDFGQERTKSIGWQTLVDDKGKEVVFNSKIDALNYMDSLGWNFLQAYTSVTSSSSGSISSTIHWLLYKDVIEGENPYIGLTTKENKESKIK